MSDKEVNIDINLEQSSKNFVVDLMLCTRFKTMYFNYGKLTFSKKILIKQELHNPPYLDYLDKNCLSNKLIKQAEDIFVEFVLSQFTPKEVSIDDLEIEIEKFKLKHKSKEITIWKPDNAPKDKIIVSCNSVVWISPDTNDLSKILKGNQLELNIRLGFDKEELIKHRAISFFKVIY